MQLTNFIHFYKADFFFTCYVQTQSSTIFSQVHLPTILAAISTSFLERIHCIVSTSQSLRLQVNFFFSNYKIWPNNRPITRVSDMSDVIRNSLRERKGSVGKFSLSIFCSNELIFFLITNP